MTNGEIVPTSRRKKPEVKLFKKPLSFLEKNHSVGAYAFACSTNPSFSVVVALMPTC